MSKTLRRHVHVTNDEGATTVFEAGSTPPGWAAKKITNPAAWESDEPDQDSEDDANPDLPEDAPPLGGKGSGVKAWREYAKSKFDLEFEDDTDRDDIVSAVATAHADSNS